MWKLFFTANSAKLLDKTGAGMPNISIASSQESEQKSFLILEFFNGLFDVN